jgi:GTP1/Obg family GTP-binding protein
MLIGPPNSGKSMLVESITNATPEVGDYPFTKISLQNSDMHGYGTRTSFRVRKSTGITNCKMRTSSNCTSKV